MKKLVFLLAFVLVLGAGCASTIDSTLPPNPTVAQFAPQAAPPEAGTPTVPSRPVGNCQSRILGRVLDANNNIVKGATVELRSSALKGTPPKTVTDDNGLYGFAGLCGGAYNFNVTLPSKKTVALNLNVGVDGAGSVKADLTVK